jgi:hypothetical protein
LMTIMAAATVSAGDQRSEGMPKCPGTRNRNEVLEQGLGKGTRNMDLGPGTGTSNSYQVQRPGTRARPRD